MGGWLQVIYPTATKKIEKQDAETKNAQTAINVLDYATKKYHFLQWRSVFS